MICTEKLHTSSATAPEEGSQSIDDVEEAGTDLTLDFRESFFRNLCLFYLKLQGQLLLPASTIQVIVEEMQNVHELGLDYTLSKLHSLLKDELNQTDDVMARVFDCIKDSDLFSSSHKGPLRTTYARTRTFKHMFQYIEPKIIRLGYDENMRQRNAYYIPLKQTLKSLLESDLWKNSQLQPTSETDACVLGDICDGKVQSVLCHKPRRTTTHFIPRLIRSSQSSWLSKKGSQGSCCLPFCGKFACSCAV